MIPAREDGPSDDRPWVVSAAERAGAADLQAAGVSGTPAVIVSGTSIALTGDWLTPLLNG